MIVDGFAVKSVRIALVHVLVIGVSKDRHAIRERPLMLKVASMKN